MHATMTIYGWCGTQATVPDDYTYAEIMEMRAVLNMLCDESNGYGEPDEENQPVNP